MRLEGRLLGVEETTKAYPRRGVRSILHAILPENTYDVLRGMRLRFNTSFFGRKLSLLFAKYLGIVAKFGFLSGLHYSFFSREFDQEHRAILVARAQHIYDVYSGSGNLYMLRRNIHRLEKGLTMKPPRPIFGLDKIGETVAAYAACLRQLDGGNEELRTSLEWSNKILGTYFNRVTAHPIVADAKRVFVDANSLCRIRATAERVPYVRSHPQNLPTIDQLEELAIFRRSVRWFDKKPVPREVIDRALQIALESPSACNRQPFRYEFFDSPELVQKVGAVPKGTPGWLHQIPCFAVIIGKFDAFRFERDRHVPYIDGCLSAMALIYGLEVQGVSSCCVNFPDYRETERRMAETLGLPPHERALMCLAIGYPDKSEKVAYSQKLPLEMARKFNGIKVLSSVSPLRN